MITTYGTAGNDYEMQLVDNKWGELFPIKFFTNRTLSPDIPSQSNIYIAFGYNNEKEESGFTEAII